MACEAPLSMGLLQARILEWVTMPFSRAPSRPRGWACVSCTAGGFFTTEPPGKLETAIWPSNSTPRFSLAQLLSHVRLWDSMDCSMTGFPVHHHLLEFAQTHVHQVGDAIQPSHPLSSPSLPALNLSQHQGLFQWVSSSHHMAKVLEFQLQHQSFQDWFPLGLTGLISLQSKGLSRVFSNTTVPKNQFFSTQLSLVQFSHPYMTTGKTIALNRQTLMAHTHTYTHTFI